MDDNMRNAWLDMISKVYTNLHNTLHKKITLN